MKSISLDFKNSMVCIMTDGQQGTHSNPDMVKEDFFTFIPEKYRDHSSYTWNFENETFAVNQDYLLHEGCIMTKDCFVPQFIIPMWGIRKRYNEFLAILNYEEVDFKSEVSESIRKLFGWDD